MRPIDADAIKEKFAEILESTYTDDYAKGYVNGLRAALNMPTLTTLNEWVSVEERLPDKPCRVLVRVTGLDILDIDTDRLVNGRWIRWPGYVTHWMPLPAPLAGES